MTHNSHRNPLIIVVFFSHDQHLHSPSSPTIYIVFLCIFISLYLSFSLLSGASWGSIEDPETLVEGARALVDNHGCTAIAVVVRFPEDDEIDGPDPDPDFSPGASTSSDIDNISPSPSPSPSPGASAASRFAAYREGSGVDFIAGAEALISHVITQRVGVPCAHAPAFSTEEGGPSPNVSPKAAAEELGYTFLPCVLAYLHKAPSLVPIGPGLASGLAPELASGPGLGLDKSGLVMSDDVDAVVVPYSAMGGPAVLSLMSRARNNNYHSAKTTTSSSSSGGRGSSNRMGGSRLRPLLVVAVGDNNTTMRVTANDLIGNDVGVNSQSGSGSGSSDRGVVEVVHVRSYAECAGVLAAHRGGIRLDSLTSNISPISIIRL